MNFENSSTISTKIDAIKLVRAFVDIGLAEAKTIVENWGLAFGFSDTAGWNCSDLSAICKLGSIAKMVKSGEWKIDSTGRIIMTKTMNPRDIMELRP